jgi:SPP1 gp7 family putative phage head morphogenesis protein
MRIEQFTELVFEHRRGPLSWRADADEAHRARQGVDKSKRKLKEADVSRAARSTGFKVSDNQKAQLKSQAKQALGIDVQFKDKSLVAKIEHFTAENVSLIKSLQSTVYSDIEKIVIRAIVAGTPSKEVAKEIAERFGVAENHARLIARDQIGKLYGQVNQARQQELGVTKFIWRHVGDRRVRSEHRARQTRSLKEPYDMDNPPDGEYPGVPVQCRCHMEPVFESIV